MREARERQIEGELEGQIDLEQLFELEGEGRLVPGVERRQAVERQAQRLDLCLIEMGGPDHRHLRETQGLRGFEEGVPINEYTIPVDQEGKDQAEGADRGFDLLPEGLGGFTQAASVRSDGAHRQMLDRGLKPGMVQASLRAFPRAPVLDGPTLGLGDDRAIAGRGRKGGSGFRHGKSPSQQKKAADETISPAVRGRCGAERLPRAAPEGAALWNVHRITMQGFF